MLTAEIHLDRADVLLQIYDRSYRNSAPPHTHRLLSLHICLSTNLAKAADLGNRRSGEEQSVLLIDALRSCGFLAAKH